MNPKNEGKNDGTMRDFEADDIEIAELSMNSKVEEKILTMDLIRQNELQKEEMKVEQ